MKYIFVTGGVVSGLGKGICAASLGRLLKQCGLRVRNQKFDPYFNVHPGTMRPYQHGEVFVTDDRRRDETWIWDTMQAVRGRGAGRQRLRVLRQGVLGGAEPRAAGRLSGGTVQIIPHITDEIKRRVYAMDNGETDVVITEIGGTVGDIEKPAVSGGYPAGGGGKGTGQCAVYPRAADRVHPGQRRAEEQAYPALRQGFSAWASSRTCWCAAPMGHHRGRAAKDRPVLQRGGGLRHPQCHGIHTVRSAAAAGERRGCAAWCAAGWDWAAACRIWPSGRLW